MTGLRIKKAKQLLQEGYTTGEVCETVGYSSMGTFKLLFKKHTRHTPHGYRQHIKRNNSETHSLTVSLFFKFYKKAISETGRTRCNHQFCDSPTNELCE
jgi:AraC-like DNA-binding protein